KRAKPSSLKGVVAVDPPAPGPEATPKEVMAHRLKTILGKRPYKLRRQTVEPVFGIICLGTWKAKPDTFLGGQSIRRLCPGRCRRHEVVLRAKRRFAAGPRHRQVGAVDVEFPGILVVLKLDWKQLVKYALTKIGGLDREQHLDAAEEIALHPVGAAGENQRLATMILEIKEAGVFEITTDDASHPD